MFNTLPFAITALYAAAAADTFASELGIMAKHDPLLLTDLLKFKVTRVPRGTNGGVSGLGIVASALGAAIISSGATATLPLCSRQWTDPAQIILVLVTISVGTVGALVDSLLGAWCQASVVDIPSGKIVEASGGGKVTFSGQHSKYQVAGKEVGKVEEKRKMLIGTDLLSNNGVNLVTGLIMAGVASVGTLFVAG